MTVKIVGKDEGAIRHTTCKNCASRLEFTNADTTTGISKDYSGCSDEYRYLICPGCGERVYVSYYNKG